MSVQFDVTQALVGMRIDAALAEIEPRLSRAAARRLIESGDIRVSGAAVKPSHRLRLGEQVEGRVPEPVRERVEPEAIPLTIVHEDLQLIVVDKPAGMVVHPGAGQRSGTLVHALLHHCRDLAGIGGVLRPGIVHRLDKGTSGLLVVAKSDLAHRHLAQQFKAHSIEREYLALVRGAPGASAGSISAPIGRHARDRRRFSTRVRVGRAALTHWTLEKRLGKLALLRVRLGTGRTHQIRVHLASVGLPVAGDPVYGRSGKASRALGLERQALHAAVLGFEHPGSDQRLRFESPLPPDLAAVIAALEP